MDLGAFNDVQFQEWYDGIKDLCPAIAELSSAEASVRYDKQSFNCFEI